MELSFILVEYLIVLIFTQKQNVSCPIQNKHWTYLWQFLYFLGIYSGMFLDLFLFFCFLWKGKKIWYAFTARNCGKYLSRIGVAWGYKAVAQPGWSESQSEFSFNILTFNAWCPLKGHTYVTNLQLKATGLFKYVWPFSGHQALKC